MATPDRAPWQIATHVRRELRQRQHIEQRMVVDQLRLASDVVGRITILSRKLEKALARRWHAAADRLHAQLRRVREESAAELAALERVMARPRAQVPAMREVAAELGQLEEEFGGWRFDRLEQALSATTEPIELEGVHLGRFEIKLRLGDLAAVPHNRCYEIVALEPNPAAGSSQVTHPHVADERLCEGEASSAIRSALAGGRLCDFFVLIRSVLSHYNPNSPYVELDNWHGEPCGECGDRVDGDRSTTCRRCEVTVCEECGEPCADCRDLYCPACLVRCERCEDLFCPGCIDRCEACGMRSCGQCLEDGLCPPCQRIQQEQEDDDLKDKPPHEPEHERPVHARQTPPAHAPASE